jgi:uncharacterized protein (DUF1800 family)
MNRRNNVMTLDPRGAALALHRFGFGPRAGTIAAIASDPRGALLAELDKPNAGRVSDAGLMSSGAASRMTSDFIAERAAKQKLETKRQEAAKEAAKRVADNPTMQTPESENAGMEKSADGKGTEAKATEANAKTPQPQPETPMLANFFREAKAHYDGAVRAEIGFAERARGDPPARARQVRRPFDCRRESFGDAELSGQFGVDGPELGGRDQPRSRSE